MMPFQLGVIERLVIVNCVERGSHGLVKASTSE